MRTRPSRKKPCENPCPNPTPKSGCKNCRFESSKSTFFRRASEKFGDTYDYSKFVYVNAKVPSTIVCKTHGEFTQTPDKHVQSTYACPECFRPVKTEIGQINVKKVVNKGNPWTVERYLSELVLDSGRHIVDLSGFKGLTLGHVKLTCVDHGESVIQPPKSLLISKHKCVSCAREQAGKSLLKTWDEFVEDSIEVHGKAYIYPEPESFTNRKSVVEIICPTHGSFYKKAQKHLSGQGCSPCNLDRLIESGALIGGYNDKLFERNPELADQTCRVYYLKVGDLYKIGITRQEVKTRIKQIRSDSKQDVTILKQLETTLLKGYTIEQKILTDHAEHRVFRPWSTELFSIDVLSGIEIIQIEGE